MQTITRRGALVAALMATGAAVSGCESSKAVSTATGDMSPADIDFVSAAYQIILFDQQECTIAQAQAQSPDVRSIATQFLDAANKFDSDLGPIAAHAGIKPPTILRTDLRVRAARLRLAQGREFDQAFIDDQIVSHQDALNIQRSMMASSGTNPQIRELSMRGTGLLEQGLARLHAIQKQQMMAPS